MIFPNEIHVTWDISGSEDDVEALNGAFRVLHRANLMHKARGRTAMLGLLDVMADVISDIDQR